MSILNKKKVVATKIKLKAKKTPLKKRVTKDTLSKTRVMKLKVKRMKIESPFIRKQTLKLRRRILELIESSIEIQHTSIKALSDIDKKNALKVLKMDDRIDLKYNTLLKDSTFLLTQQPFGKELRRVIGYIQIGKNLEWIGDCAVEIAKFIISFKDKMSESSQSRIKKIHKLLSKSLSKLEEIIVNEDEDQALQLAKWDESIDSAILQVSSSLIRSITKVEKISLVNERVYVLKILDSLESAGDHIVDICEIIIYIKTGTLHGLD